MTVTRIERPYDVSGVIERAQQQGAGEWITNICCDRVRKILYTAPRSSGGWDGGVSVSEQIHAPDYNQVWANVYGDMQHVGPVHRHMKRITRGLLKNLNYRSILDVGCGPGDNIALLSGNRSISHVSGIDISTWAVEQAQKRYPRDFHAFDVEKNDSIVPGTWFTAPYSWSIYPTMSPPSGISER